MTAAHLAESAARIAAAFHALPDDAAIAAIAAHINQFWAAPMRRGFLAIAPARLEPRLRAVQKLVRPPRRG
jgi:formate dehydrogenase subunit delta